MNSFFEIDYEIEATLDEYGDFPLYCATLLFDLLNIKSNIVIKNQHTIKAEKKSVIQQYTENKQNYYYEWPRSPDGNYCIWIKEKFLSNHKLIDLLKLQGIYLSYIVPNETFDWNKFLVEWKKDNINLLSSNQASFICNVIDMDRTLNLIFNISEFPREEIIGLLNKWERAIESIAQSTQVIRTETQMRSKYGSKILVQLKYS